MTDEEWNKYCLERLKYNIPTDWVKPPEFATKKEEIKAKIKCFFHGHLYEYNGDIKTLVWGMMPTYKCTRCGKVKYSFKDITK